MNFGEGQMHENINVDDGTRITIEEGLERYIKWKCIEEEGYLFKYVKKEVYVKDLTKGERTYDDWSLTMESLGKD